MSQAYSDPKRESDPHALPDLEVFEHRCGGRNDVCPTESDDPTDCPGPGWYYWFCFPGCLPDGEPMGPFETEAEALADAQEGIEEE